MVKDGFNDPADYRQASQKQDLTATLDSLLDNVIEETRGMVSEEAVAIAFERFKDSLLSADIDGIVIERLQIIVGIILDTKNLKLTALGLAYAYNLGLLNGAPMRSMEKKLMVTRAAISKETVRMQKMTNVHPSRYMKSPAAQVAYSKRQTEVYLRKHENERSRLTQTMQSNGHKSHA